MEMRAVIILLFGIVMRLLPVPILVKAFPTNKDYVYRNFQIKQLSYSSSMFTSTCTFNTYNCKQRQFNLQAKKQQHHHDLDLATTELSGISYGGMFESNRGMLSRPYVSYILYQMDSSSLSNFLSTLDDENNKKDPLWEQIKLEALHTLDLEPSAGPQLYTFILSQISLLHALTSIVSHEIETELIPATSLQNLFHEMLHPIEDTMAISLDLMKSAMRSSSEVDSAALLATLFHQGLHALVCHRLAHRLWLADRTSLAYYIQSTVSRKYSTDIHPAAKFGVGIYLNAGSAGVVIGETAVIDHDVTILQGVTLGGTVSLERMYALPSPCFDNAL